MKISEALRQELVKELRYVVDRVRTESDPRKKIYFFSGAYGHIQRVFNIDFDPQLLLMHFILNGAYEILRGRTDAMILGRDTLIDIPEAVLNGLCDALEELAKEIESDRDTYLTLQRIVSLAYIGTGNGYYLYQKGVIKP